MKKSVLIAVVMYISINIAGAQQIPFLEQQIPLIGDEAPSFNAMSTHGQISFPEDFGENWKILFAHPRNFTPVCSSEILELAYHQDDFKRLEADLIVISTDKISMHHAWKDALEEVRYGEKGKTVEIKFPMVADPTYEIAYEYGMLESAESPGKNIRGVFFIDPENRIRAFQFYPNEVGRSIDEIKRTLAALQTNYRDNTALLPANWNPGDDVMLPYYPEPHETIDLESSESEYYKLTWFMTFRKND
jgi:peroxiredoxin 2/4